MKKSILILLATIFATFRISANVHSKIQDAFSTYERTSKIGRYNVDFLKKFVGDTIMFDFSNQYMDCFTVEQPDTIWIKKRPKKNPEIGKHYILNHAYKGVEVDEKFFTPTSAINGKPFVVYSIKPYTSNEGCQILLLDLDNLDVITFNVPRSFSYDGTFTTTKTKRLIDSLVNEDVYYSPDVPTYYSSSSKPSFTKCKLINGEFQVVISKSTGMYHDYALETTCVLRLQDDKGNVISMSPLKTSEYARTNPIVLTQPEYDEQFRGYSLNSDVDIAILDNEANFPFSFVIIPAYTKSSFTSVYQFVEPNSSYRSADAHLDKAVITIGDALTIANSKYYKACFNGKAFFIKETDVILTEENGLRLDTLLQQPQNIRDDFFKRQIALSKALYLDKLDESINQIKSYSKYGLAIPSWGVYDVSEYTDGTGIRFSFLNPTNSTIKYVNITFQGYNAVDDPVGRAMTKKCIGPIEPDETASYDFEYAWFTDVVEYAKIRSISVIYKNGTTKTISNPKNIMFPKELRDFLYSSNPVEKLK